MRKVFIFISILFLSINSSFACKIQNFGKEIPKTFKTNCYEKIGELNPETSGVNLGDGNTCVGYKTFLINSPQKIDTFINNNQILPWKLFKNAGESINFKINLEGNTNYLSDDNYKTFFELDTEKNTTIKIELDKLVKAGNSIGNFSYESKNYFTEYLISEDGNKYSKVDISHNGSKLNLGDFDFKYLKINFIPRDKNNILREKIKIAELNIKSTNYQYLVKTLGKIKAYSKNICNNNYSNLSNKNSEFNLNIDTEILNLNLIKNPEFDTFKKEDSDNDKIENSIDNCPSTFNPKQKDKDGNGIGDMCSDDDSDGIIGEKDNCPYIYNPSQKDINRNHVGDKCEFDKDKDGIFDKLDNCINTPNPEQIDKDNDQIGDKCDNSIYYNPRQIDKNNNGIGDITEEKEKYLKENDKDKDGIIDFKDNCKTIPNNNQLDTDKDGIGDVCDNCTDYQNSDQLDFNKNGVGDICEDSDNDGIEGIKDNCINVANSDQKDSDNNGTGDACEDSDGDKILFLNDNCPYEYNPLQSDIDGDGVGDICDKKDNRFLESNKNIFLIILAIIIAIFGVAIFKMAKKLK